MPHGKHTLNHIWSISIAICFMVLCINTANLMQLTDQRTHETHETPTTYIAWVQKNKWKITKLRHYVMRYGMSFWLSVAPYYPVMMNPFITQMQFIKQLLISNAINTALCRQFGLKSISFFRISRRTANIYLPQTQMWFCLFIYDIH